MFFPTKLKSHQFGTFYLLSDPGCIMNSSYTLRHDEVNPRPWIPRSGKFSPSKLKPCSQETNWPILFIIICKISIAINTMNMFQINKFSLYIIIPHYFIASIHTHIYICYFELENESRSLIYFTINTYQVKFKYSLRSSTYMC